MYGGDYMKVNDTQNYIQLQMMSEIMKETLGDSDSFQLVLESMMKAAADSNTDLSSLGISDSNTPEQLPSNANIDEAVEKASDKYNIDKDLIMSVINQESAFNPYAKSSAGAMGLMQLMPDTADEMGVTDPYNVDENIDGGTHYLKSLLDMYAQNKELALSAYNAGPGTLLQRGVDSSSEIDKLPDETRNYVSSIMKSYGKK
jgi:soluble lytic murein transglycosylase-like protein